MESSAGPLDQLNGLFSDYVVGLLGQVMFWDVVFWDNGQPDDIQLPIVVLWLVVGSIFFTLRFQFINFRAFRHAIDCVRGKYSHEGEEGEITHFQALSAALSATVGLGNIAGVAVAVTVGGPGALFWMVVAGFLGMSSKFAECTLGQMYRVVQPDGHVSGGPMHYLKDGLEEIGAGGLGRVLSVIFAVMCIGGSLGGGNMFQANQSYAQVAAQVPFFDSGFGAVVFGLLLAGLVGVVILGGIKRIGEVAGFLVPIMCSVYVAAGIAILLFHAAEVPHAFGVIFDRAFSFEAGLGGFIGVLIQGFRRAAFSNEAGIGSASIAHSAATTDEPIREGLVSLLEPFIDTIVVCTMTGLVIVVTGAYDHPDAGEGIQMTSFAFGTVFDWFPALLSLTAVLFAFSTMISWSYYGERCWASLFGAQSVVLYKILFLICTWAGAMFSAQSVLDFGDLMILGMAFPNITGVVLMSGKIRTALNEYMRKLRAGEFELTSR